MISSITILGGGTAGLITSLILKKWYPVLDITVIESSNIGIVGVGEGSTEHWSVFMKAVGIKLKDLISETGATFKTGIKFDNWNGDGKFYMHSLHANFTEPVPSGVPGIMIQMMIDGAEHLTPASVLNSTHYFPLSTTVNQYHFDTYKLNTFFHKICLERGIKFVNDDIVDVVLDQDGFVKELVSDSNKYSADFFIDSSGFRRIIASKLGANWRDCKDYLPMNRAFAFPTPGTEEIPSHTLSRALSSGWMWRIPTQTRYGNGYVFSDNFISETEAFDEIQKYYPDEIQVGKSFKFSAGYLENPWIKNCVSIGLSSSFVEPLEASSIGTSIQQAFGFGAAILNWSKGQDKTAEKYNIQFSKVSQNIIDFVQLHYFTKRDDSNFWKSCKQDIKITDFNKETLDYLKHSIPLRSHFTEPFILFTEQNWIQIMYGLGLSNIESISKLWMNQDPNLIEEARKKIANVAEFQSRETYFQHRDALNFIMSDNFNE
jgi:tryptophan halogenase